MRTYLLMRRMVSPPLGLLLSFEAGRSCSGIIWGFMALLSLVPLVYQSFSCPQAPALLLRGGRLANGTPTSTTFGKEQYN